MAQLKYAGAELLRPGTLEMHRADLIRWPGCEAGNPGPMAQALPKQLADALWNNPTGILVEGTCVRSAILAAFIISVFPITRGRQKSAKLGRFLSR